MENPLIPFLNIQGFLVIDGALATELERRGGIIDGPLWSARLLQEHPEMIRQLHEDYFAAGADITITASYQASFEGFAEKGLTRRQAADLLELSVDLARQARDGFWSDPANRPGRLRPLVAASVGPYGAFLADGSEYRGDYGLSVEALMDWHRPRMAVLAGAGADLLACETIPCMEEAEALLRLLDEFPGVYAWLSFSCGDDKHLCHGEPFARAAGLAQESPRIVAIGVNCTDPHYVESLLYSAAGRTTKPLLAYPNSGEHWDAGRRCWIPAAGTPGFGALARDWFGAGARLIGGCCRTGLEEVKEIRMAMATVADNKS